MNAIRNSQGPNYIGRNGRHWCQFHTPRPSTVFQVLNHHRHRHVASKAETFWKLQNKQNIVSVGKRCLILIPLLEIGIILTKISDSHWQMLASHSCGCSNTAQKDDSNDSYAIPHYKVDMFIQSRRYLNFWRLKTVRRFFNNKVPLYFAILRGHKIPECVLVKLAV